MKSWGGEGVQIVLADCDFHSDAVSILWWYNKHDKSCHCPRWTFHFSNEWISDNLGVRAFRNYYQNMSYEFNDIHYFTMETFVNCCDHWAKMLKGPLTHKAFWLRWSVVECSCADSFGLFHISVSGISVSSSIPINAIPFVALTPLNNVSLEESYLTITYFLQGQLHVLFLGVRKSLKKR